MSPPKKPRKLIDAASLEDKKDSGWDLPAFHAGLQAASNKREQEALEFSKKLGEPDASLFEDYGDYKIEVGFWRGDGGVISYRRQPGKPWDQYTRNEYTDEKLAVLSKVAGMAVRK